MTFSKTWVELIIWGIISKRARYKWRVSTNISKHRNRLEKWVATLSKNFFLSWYQLKHSHSCFIYIYFHWWPDIGWNTPTVDSCFTFYFVLISDETLLHLFGISPLRVWISHEILQSVFEHTQSVLRYRACLINLSDWISDETLPVVFYR